MKNSTGLRIYVKSQKILLKPLKGFSITKISFLILETLMTNYALEGLDQPHVRMHGMLVICGPPFLEQIL